MKNKLVKVPKKYKYGFRLAGDPANWNWFLGRFRYPRWIVRPICWVTKHKYRIYWPYGVKIKECERCSHRIYKKNTTERVPNNRIFKGEIGEIYGVRFLRTIKKKIHL